MKTTKCASCGARYPGGRPPGGRCTTCGARQNFRLVSDEEHAAPSEAPVAGGRVAERARLERTTRPAKPLKIAGQDLESIRQLIETCKDSGVREIELDIEDSEMAEVQSSLGNLIPVRLELGPIKIGRTRKRTVILRF